MSRIEFDYSEVKKFITTEELDSAIERSKSAREILMQGTGKGNDFLGWVDLPVNYDRDEFERIKKAANKIRNDSEILVVIGIGGSYLGARAAIDFLNHSFYNDLPDSDRRGVKVYYAGNNISGSYLCDLLDIVKDRDFSINVISKSGTTTEPAIAFRIFKELCEKKYGKKDAAGRIYATTDKSRGALKELADKEGYETFVVPDDIGGRYSVLTAVGLLPIAATGVDIDKLMAGAARGRSLAIDNPVESNPAMQYAAVRNILYDKGKAVEIMGNFEPHLHYISEWWKQLFGESEGKDGKGIFPAAIDMTTDLHSMGQFIQEGTRLMFETVINVQKPCRDVCITEDEDNLDKLNYLAGRNMDFVNKSAMTGTCLAHIDGGVPNMRINIEGQDEESLGELFYFFEFACGISGYMLGVNPFDQPGVESYKKNMFALLGKPGYEEETSEIMRRLGMA